MLRGTAEWLKEYISDVVQLITGGKLFEDVTRTTDKSQITTSISVTAGSRDTTCSEGSIAKSANVIRDTSNHKF